MLSSGLDAAADADDHLRRGEIDGLRGGAEGLAGAGADLGGVDGWREGGDGGRGCRLVALSAGKAPAWTETKQGPLPVGR